MFSHIKVKRSYIHELIQDFISDRVIIDIDMDELVIYILNNLEIGVE